MTGWHYGTILEDATGKVMLVLEDKWDIDVWFVIDLDFNEGPPAVFPVNMAMGNWRVVE